MKNLFVVALLLVASVANAGQWDRIEAKVDSALKCCAEHKKPSVVRHRASTRRRVARAPVYRPYRQRLAATPAPAAVAPAPQIHQEEFAKASCEPHHHSWVKPAALIGAAVLGAALILRDHGDDEGVRFVVGTPSGPPSSGGGDDDDGDDHDKGKGSKRHKK